MLNFIKNIFSPKTQQNKIHVVQISEEEKKENKRLLELYTRKILEKNHFFDNSKTEIIIKHVLGEINLLKSENNLSLEKKKSLGINSKVKISRELIDIFDSSKLNINSFKEKNPKDLLLNLSQNAKTRMFIISNLRRIKSLDFIKYVYLTSPNDERTCNWCKEQSSKKIDINTDIIKLIDENCNCEYNRSTLISDINIDEILN